jgi:hypothetical protein
VQQLLELLAFHQVTGPSKCLRRTRTLCARQATLEVLSEDNIVTARQATLEVLSEDNIVTARQANLEVLSEDNIAS